MKVIFLIHVYFQVYTGARQRAAPSSTMAQHTLDADVGFVVAFQLHHQLPYVDNVMKIGPGSYDVAILLATE